ncbi:hypothetical protein OAH88_00385 [Candidatus Pelagibacter sp.]|nr:hypothetical protein [Candidatus Pelagibacter sp.]|tara:strand:- start:322 stop:1011 length:690 start_codon:yes stop_codon:yes gene_type:complete
MDKIKRVKAISIWIFIIPFLAINICLLLITHFHGLFPSRADIIHPVFPYFDGGASISRTARVFPTYLIFKPAMFLTSYFLIKYWFYNKSIIQSFNNNHKYLNKIIFFGVGSAILLILHSIFLGIKIDNDLYKFFRRFVMVSFIVFEVTAQTYLVLIFYSLKKKLNKFINKKILKLKIYLVSMLIIIGIISIPILVMDGNKSLKHALEWDYFVGVISFYLLTFFMWKKIN